MAKFVDDKIPNQTFDMAYRGKRGMSTPSSGAVKRSLKLGAMESFGWHIEGFGEKAATEGNKGFLGRQLWAADKAKGGVSKAVGGMAFRSMPLAFTGYFMYQGYKEGGVVGAAKEAAYSVGTSAAFHYVGATLGSAAPWAMAAGAPLAAVGGAYVLGEAGRAHAKGLRQMEMGQSDQMQDAVNSQGAATMRQRSAAALSNTHINGRMALGNEGFLMHRSFGG